MKLHFCDLIENESGKTRDNKIGFLHLEEIYLREICQKKKYLIGNKSIGKD